MIMVGVLFLLMILINSMEICGNIFKNHFLQKCMYLYNAIHDIMMHSVFMYACIFKITPRYLHKHILSVSHCRLR